MIHDAVVSLKWPKGVKVLERHCQIRRAVAPQPYTVPFIM